VKWRVENSHGEKSGKKGFYVMADNWFDEWLYEVVVNKIYLPEKFLRSLDTPPIMLPPWDPIGALAGDCPLCCQDSGAGPDHNHARL
jgi:bleomycin hydrolase